ncbi:MAG: DNA polymerase III subunit alpha [Patescibacteria group bacterium]|nr:DNA polymerase III subunit alpha [Patescibacteria group bacterium]
MVDFVHLHTHSEYSLLDGLGKLPHLIDRAKSYGMDALALTDHGAMYGIFKFYMKAKSAGIKPILGVETYVARRSRHDKEGKIDTDPYHFLLLAKNETGYKNLLKLVTKAHLEGYYYKPRIDMELLQEYHDGLIATSACVQGQIASLIRNNDEKQAETIAATYNELFGQGNFYIELQRHPSLRFIEDLNQRLIRLARKLGIPLVATNDIHYVDAEDAEAQEILLCVQTQKTILDKDRPLSMINSPDFYMRSPDEMKSLFLDIPEAIDNTLRIAEMCNVELSVGKWILPKFPIPEGYTPESYLRKLIEERIPTKYPKFTEEMKKRLEYELEIINKKGYTNYFLIVQDFVNWAKEQGISVGPGRGSAAGSMVTYILNITGIDPLYFNLPFERFLNPYRPSAPDIDLDFADDRREEVIQYVTKKFGEDKVASIITFGTMEAKGSIRDAGRALGMPYAKPDRIAKMIPPPVQGKSVSIEKAIEQSSELALAYKTELETKRLLDVARKLEGVARHASVHAAGVVISDKPLWEYVPLQRESKGQRIITQYDMYTVGEEGVGLLKMDFLGLRNLTILSETLKFIEINTKQKIDLSSIPLDDKRTYAMLSEGETTGIFQLESAGMRRYIKELKPTSIFDLMAMVALYRPGPMGVIPEFIARKHDPSRITYPDPRLKDVLKTSYGLICYQDDVLLTSIKLAGYTWEDADKLRKAVGKKISAEMKKQREKFIEGCVKNGLSRSKAEEIFGLIEPFAGYGFNKAHAACYAMIAYQTAYLKANYPVEFMTALLTAESRANTGDTKDEKISMIVDECRRMNIQILLPDINHSGTEFSIEHGKIRFGLSAIKNVGSAAIETILAARNKDGVFVSLFDFVKRVDTAKVNRKTLESLIKSGAMDAFGSRGALLSSLESVLERVQKTKKASYQGQGFLFGEEEFSNSVETQVISDFSLSHHEMLAYEKELLGFYFSAHPLSKVMAKLSDFKAISIGLLDQDSIGQRVTVCGMVRALKKIITKSTNQEMAFIKLEDTSGSIECIIFPKVYLRYSQFWQTDIILLVSGKVDEKDEQLSLLVDEVKKIEVKD